MKYIKKYESRENIKELKEDLKKLLLHIKDVLSDYYVTTINFSDWQYSIYFSIPQSTERVFDIQGEFSTTSTFLSITLRVGSIDDNFAKFIPKYFNNIDGLMLYSENPSFFNTQYIIFGDIDNIISQITIEDMEIIASSIKYNL